MKMFFAQLSDKSTIKVTADRMEVADNMAYVYDLCESGYRIL